MNAPAALIGDIGGTNTRLALARERSCADVVRYVNAEMTGIESCLAEYLARYRLDPSQLDLVLAVAAPVADDAVTLTNLDWTFSRSALAAHFGFARVEVVNDFYALAHAVPALGAADLVTVGRGRARAGSAALVLGPGTGFGASLWLPGGTAMATEAGHALMAGVSEDELAVLATLRDRFGVVSHEQVLSGSGLVNLYTAVAGRVAAEGTRPERIAADGAGGRNPAAVEVMRLFFAFLGIAARNLALASGARGGVYLAGGILPRYADALRASLFRQRFETPAPLGDYLPSIPTALIVHPEPALLGLAVRHAAAPH